VAVSELTQTAKFGFSFHQDQTKAASPYFEKQLEEEKLKMRQEMQ